MSISTVEVNLEEVETVLRKYIETFQTQEEAAASLGVSRIFLWKVLNRKKPFPATMLEKLGYEREVERVNTYIKKDTE